LYNASRAADGPLRVPLVYIAAMKVVIAPDSFKDSLGAVEVAAALAAGLRQVLPTLEIVEAPMADGGEGTLLAMARGGGIHLESVRACNALGERGEARYGMRDDGLGAVIEVADVVGLQQVPVAQRSPMRTSSFGVGELILACLDRGVRQFLIGLGGSATVDGGAGMLQALGARFFDRHGDALPAPLRGQDLKHITALDLGGLDPRLADSRVDIASDVDNPLCGPHGAAAVFGPQKGASAAEVEELDAGLRGLFGLLEVACRLSVADRPGAGAAGGLGAALMLVLNGRLRPGVEVVMEAVDLERQLRGAALVVTGEGRVDAQTLFGKAPAGVARLAHALGIPVVAVGGSVESLEALWRSGVFDAIEAAVSRPCVITDALRDASANLTEAGMRVGLWLSLASKLHPLP
jgi:glycerate kinase